MSDELNQTIAEICEPTPDALRVKYALCEPFRTDGSPSGAAVRVASARVTESQEALQAEGLATGQGLADRTDSPGPEALADLFAMKEWTSFDARIAFDAEGADLENWETHTWELYDKLIANVPAPTLPPGTSENSSDSLAVSAPATKAAKTAAELADEQRAKLEATMKPTDLPKVEPKAPPPEVDALDALGDLAIDEIFDVSDVPVIPVDAKAGDTLPGGAVLTKAGEQKVKKSSEIAASESAPVKTESAAPGTPKPADAPAMKINTAEPPMTDALLAELIGCEVDKIQKFKVTDKASAEWYVNQVSGIQLECEKIATMATAMINDRLRAIKEMQFRYERDVKPIAQRELKKGTKSWKTLFGGFFFRKTGGTYCHDRELVEAWLNKLPDSELAKYGAERKLSFDVRKVKAAMLADPKHEMIPGFANKPVDEYGECGVGTTRRWTTNKLTDILGSIKHVLGGHDEDEDANS